MSERRPEFARRSVLSHSQKRFELVFSEDLPGVDERDPFMSEDLFLEIACNRGDQRIVLEASLRLDKLMQTLGKNSPAFGELMKGIWAIFLPISASLGNSFGQIRTYPNWFGQFCTCPNTVFAGTLAVAIQLYLCRLVLLT